ncbi:uncharacterized protein LOC142350422 [Convolutriloba macropyga]|uniref:uncharacterized protein LOC142350422 n=1 Tax=Convolutriloba macropyga TaxID=536237 RepID=UPI003F526584
MNLLFNLITKHQKSIKLVFTIIALSLVKQQSATVTDVESSFKDESFDPENVNLEENLVELSSHIAELPMSLLNSEQQGPSDEPSTSSLNNEDVKKIEKILEISFLESCENYRKSEQKVMFDTKEQVFYYELSRSTLDDTHSDTDRVSVDSNLSLEPSSEKTGELWAGQGFQERFYYKNRGAGFPALIWSYDVMRGSGKRKWRLIGRGHFYEDVSLDEEGLKTSMDIGGKILSYEELEKILVDSVEMIPRLETYNIPQECKTDYDCQAWQFTSGKPNPRDRFMEFKWDCLSPRVEDDCGSTSKVFATIIDLSASGNCDMASSSLVIHFVKLNPPLMRTSLTFW